jgi:protein-tyrosine phosphatase
MHPYEARIEKCLAALEVVYKEMTDLSTRSNTCLVKHRTALQKINDLESEREENKDTYNSAVAAADKIQMCRNQILDNIYLNELALRDAHAALGEAIRDQNF